MNSASAFAPAKINLTLHVTGQRADGYHLLDSLVVFAGIGDHIHVTPGNGLSLNIQGAEANGLDAGQGNLVMRAAQAFGPGNKAALTLTKNLPVASGIGGGSADAAATLTALAGFWQLPLPNPQQILGLGADVPVCLFGQTARLRGIGDDITAAPPLPDGMGLLLVNPRIALATPSVFARLACKENAPMPAQLPRFAQASELADWLQKQRNDLQPSAIDELPVIADVLGAITATDPLLARMSGSGATCFGLYATEDDAKSAAAQVIAKHPEWWVRQSWVQSGRTRA